MSALTYLGTYEHYKGGLYTLLAVAENSEDRSQLMAVYLSHAKHKVLVRPWLMFNEIVQWPDGQQRPRFRRVARMP